MKGRVVYLFAFDVATEIRTSPVRELLSRKVFPFQIQVGVAAPRDVRIYEPLTVAFEPEELETPSGRAGLRPFVKIYEIGALSVSFEVEVDVDGLAALAPYHRVDLRARAERLAAQVADALRPHLVKPAAAIPPTEAYTVFCLRDVPGTAEDWCRERRDEIAALLNEEPEPARLSGEQVEETWSRSLSYTRGDMAVVDWDAALVVDQGGYFDDVLYVIELANLQLEEFRLLDDLLDRNFLEAYDDLEKYGGSWRILFTPARRLHALRSLRMDVTKLSEELANITKFVGDWYLARVYLACRERFHLKTWEGSVDQKLQELDRIYSLVMSDIGERRMLVLEVMIVALFVVDLLALFVFRR
jgi:hypothetical protein